MADEDQTFESQDSGASDRYPIEAGAIRKGGHIIIKDNPCKVLDVSTSKTGKHGHAKCHFVAQHIFTGKKIEDLVPASHTTYAPVIKKTEYQCIGVDDGYVSLMDADGNLREDLKLPNQIHQPPPEADTVSKSIQEKVDEGIDFNCIVLSACGMEVIMEVKVLTGGAAP